MKNRTKLGEDIFRSIFDLTQKGTTRRFWLRLSAFAGLWVVLTGISTVLTLLSAQESTHKATLAILNLLKYIPLLVVVYLTARSMAARYLMDIFEIADEKVAVRFIEETAFGGGRERVTITDGRITPEEQSSPVVLIGGPGEIQVNLGSAALLELADGTPHVIYPRGDVWNLERFERLREIGKKDEVGEREYAIINLRDQMVSRLSIRSRTKDGIPIEANDIKVIFRVIRKLDENGEPDQNAADEDAIQALVYKQFILTPEPGTRAGVNFPWDSTIIPLIYSELESLITSRTLSEILATISQKEVDHAATDDETIAQMRVEMTGQQAAATRKEALPPNFESRSKITAQFYDKPFTDKAAELGVVLEWIDIGTWQLPTSIILDKHKEAWALSRDNASRRLTIERSKQQHEFVEIVNLINNVVIANYEKPTPQGVSSREVEVFLAANPELAKRYFKQGTVGKNAPAIALEILKAFRKELLAARLLIDRENRPLPEKQADLDLIDKTLFNIQNLTNHWV